MSNGPPVKLLGDVVEFQRGLTYAKGDEVESSGNIVLRATNIDLNTNLLDLVELRYISDKFVVPPGKRVKKDSLLICTASGSKSHLGKVAYIDDDYGYAFGGFMGMLTPKVGLLPRFLFHALTSRTYKDFIDNLSDGANINNLKFDDLARFPIPLPPLPEQRRIVAILDEAFAAIATAKANTEKNLANVEELFESCFESLFVMRGQRWQLKSLGELCQVKTGRKDVNEGNPAGQFPFFTCAAEHTYSDSYSFDTEAILIAGNGNVGQAAYYVGKFEAYQRTYVLSQFSGIDAKYLFRVLDVRLSRKVSKEKLGNTMPYIKIGMLTDFLVPVPPIAEQRAVLRVLDNMVEEIERLKSIAQQKLAALDALRASFLHQAFTGQLPASTK